MEIIEEEILLRVAANARAIETRIGDIRKPKRGRIRKDRPYQTGCVIEQDTRWKICCERIIEGIRDGRHLPGNYRAEALKIRRESQIWHPWNENVIGGNAHAPECPYNYEFVCDGATNDFSGRCVQGRRR